MTRIYNCCITELYISSITIWVVPSNKQEIVPEGNFIFVGWYNEALESFTSLVQDHATVLFESLFKWNLS